MILFHIYIHHLCKRWIEDKNDVLVALPGHDNLYIMDDEWRANELRCE